MDHAAHIRKALTRYRLTDIARASGLPKTTIHSIKTGATAKPQYGTVLSLEAAIAKLDRKAAEATKGKPRGNQGETKAKARPVSNAEAANPKPGSAGAIWRSTTTVSERQQALRRFDLPTVRAALAVGGVQDSVTKALEARERVLAKKAAAR